MWTLLTYEEGSDCTDFGCAAELVVCTCSTVEDLQREFTEVKLAEAQQSSPIFYYIFKGENLLEGDWDNPEVTGGLDIEAMIETAEQSVQNRKALRLKEAEERTKRAREAKERIEKERMQYAKERLERDERSELSRLAQKYGYNL